MQTPCDPTAAQRGSVQSLWLLHAATATRCRPLLHVTCYALFRVPLQGGVRGLGLCCHWPPLQPQSPNYWDAPYSSCTVARWMAVCRPLGMCSPLHRQSFARLLLLRWRSSLW